MRKFLFMLTLMVFILTGCTQTAGRIYTICKISQGNTYVYDGSGNFYQYKDGKVIPCYTAGLQTKPLLVISFPEPSTYTITEDIPTVYNATYNDTMKYLATVLVNDNAVYTVTSVDWKSFELYVKTENYIMRAIYTDDNKLRLYMDNGGAPPYL